MYHANKIIQLVWLYKGLPSLYSDTFIHAPVSNTQKSTVCRFQCVYQNHMPVWVGYLILKFRAVAYLAFWNVQLPGYSNMLTIHIVQEVFFVFFLYSSILCPRSLDVQSTTLWSERRLTNLDYLLVNKMVILTRSQRWTLYL